MIKRSLIGDLCSMFISPPSLEFKHPIKKRFIWWSARRHFKMKEVCWSQKVLVFWTGSAEFVLCQGYSRNINLSQIQIRKSRNSNTQILCVFWFQLWRCFQFDWKLLLGTHPWAANQPHKKCRVTTKDHNNESVGNRPLQTDVKRSKLRLYLVSLSGHEQRQ